MKNDRCTKTSQPKTYFILKNNIERVKDYHFVHFDFNICTTLVRQFNKLMQFNKGINNQTQLTPKFLTKFYSRDNFPP